MRTRVEESIIVGLFLVTVLLVLLSLGCGHRVIANPPELTDDEEDYTTPTVEELNAAARDALAKLYKDNPRYAIHAHWNGVRWTCPDGMLEWASEKEAIENGKDFVYCVPDQQRKWRGRQARCSR